MLRILTVIEGLDREFAFELVYNTFAYTNHTVLPEALEKWSIELLGTLLPRHLEIIYLINHFWLEKVSKKYPGNFAKMSSLSIIEEGTPKVLRMANLSIIGSHSVNGVAALHSELIKNVLFKDFFEMNPKKFNNKTNGVTPRRWIKACNPKLTEIYDTKLGKNVDWL
jgi:starch phosphorylase